MRRPRGRGNGPPSQPGGRTEPVVDVSHDSVASEGDNSHSSTANANEGTKDDLVEATVDMSLNNRDTSSSQTTPHKEDIHQSRHELPMSLPVPQPAPVGMSHASTMPSATSSPATVMPSLTSVTASPSSETQTAPKAFLKMGKWEAPAPLDASAFQFGSFGSFSSTNAVSDEPLSSTATTSNTWGSVIGASAANSNGLSDASRNQQQSSEEKNQSTEVQIQVQATQPAQVPPPAVSSLTSPGVWGSSAGTSSPVDNTTSSSTGPTPMSSLFPTTKTLSDNSTPVISSSSQSTNRYDHKPSAPPGLEAHAHTNMAKVSPQGSRSAAPGGSPSSRAKNQHDNSNQPQPLQQQQTPQSQLQQPQLPQAYQQQTYQQPPAGIPNPTSRTNVSSIPNMPYAYAPTGFDLQAQYALHQSYQPPIVAPTVPGSSTVSTTGTPTTASSTPGTPQQQQPQQPYGPPPGMGPAGYANPYYPYYPNQPAFYYPNQVQNPYFNQGRNVYQNPRGPYGTDPYAAAGSMYPDVFQQNAQFSDATGTYGAMPMHPGQMSIPGAAGTTTTGGTQGTTGGKVQKGGVGASSTTPQQQQQTSHMSPDPSLAYAYNPYNPRDAGSWQGYPQSSAQGWGGPMMGFPGVSPAGATGQPQGFTQQAGMPSQQQQQQQQPTGGQRPPNNTGYNVNGQQQSFTRGSTGTTGGQQSGTTGTNTGGGHW